MKTSDQKQLVKLLYLEHGHQKASELSGVRYDLVRKWASLGNWKALHNPSQSPVARASDNVASQLAQLKERSTLNLARYAAEASEQAVNQSDKLKISRKAVDVATVHRSVWPQEQNQNNILQIGFLISDEDAPGTSEKATVGHIIEPSESE